MRRALIPWLLLGLALVAIVVPMAQGTSSAKDPRVAGLIKKVNVLQKQVAALIVKSNCLGAQGVVLRGTPASQDGYVYKRAADPTPQWLYTALDAPATGETPSALFATVDASCVAPSRTLYRSGGGLVAHPARSNR
jgi:hypothetical protein